MPPEHAPLSRRSGRAMKVAVVGAGVMGCATAWALARARGGRHGLRAVRAGPHARLEPRPHAHLPPRISRGVLGAARAGGVRGWRELEQETGGRCSSCTGSSSWSRAGGDVGARARACGVEHRLLDADEARAPASSCRPAGSRSGSRTRASCSPTARSPRSRGDCRVETAGASSRSTRSTRTSSSSPRARGSRSSSPTCRCA